MTCCLRAGQFKMNNRMITTQCQLSLVFIFLTACVPALASNARGYVLAQCPMTGDSRLHITNIDGRKLNPELYLRIPEETSWERYKEWYEVKGETCLPSGECESTTHTEVQILHVSRNHFPFFHRGWTTNISGNFEIELQDGRKLAGSFKAKLRNPPKGHYCA